MQAPVEFVTALTEVTRTVQQFSTAPLILGGPAVGVMPESLLRRTQAACAVLGDGETVFPALLRALSHGGGFEGVPRLAWLDQGHYHTSAAVHGDLSHHFCTPDYPRWLDLKAYRANLTSVPLQSKRGCPFSCIYCTYGLGEGREYRLLPPAEVAEAVAAPGRHGLP